MRRAAFALISTVTGLVLLLSFKTHAVVATAASSPPAAVTGSTDTTGTTTTTTTPAPSASPSAKAATAPATKTVTGNSVSTRWGPVQVQVTVSAGKVTAAQAIVYPQGNGKDQEINAYALPILNKEAVDASSANIDMVSGATVTSDGYITSLQSALDKV